MTIDHNVQTIINTGADLHLPVPAPVTEARAFQTAALALLDAVRAEQAPDLDSATVKTITQAHAAAVEFDTAHDAKIKHAETLVKIGETRVSQAWGPAASRMEPAIAAEFDRLATEFAAELQKLGDVDAEAVADDHWNPAYVKVRGLADRLSTLKNTRDAFANRAARTDIGADAFERMSRVLVFESFADAISPPRPMGRNAPVEFAYWAAAARHPDIQIRWQTRTQQEAQVAVAPFVRQRATTAALLAEREGLTP